MCRSYIKIATFRMMENLIYSKVMFYTFLKFRSEPHTCCYVNNELRRDTIQQARPSQRQWDLLRRKRFRNRYCVVSIHCSGMGISERWRSWYGLPAYRAGIGEDVAFSAIVLMIAVPVLATPVLLKLANLSLSKGQG